MTADRLTEIKARVASKIEISARHGAQPPSWASDLEYALGEIERLHDISAFNGLTEQVKALSAERDRLRAALERAERVNAMVSALAVTTDELRRIRNARKITFDKMVYAITTCLIDMRAALEDKPAHTTACLIKQSGGWPCTCRAALEESNNATK